VGKERRTGFSKDVRNLIKMGQGNTCPVTGNTQNLEVHHITPLSHGGSNSPENGVALDPYVHILMDKMAIQHGIYYHQIMELGIEYAVATLNAVPRRREDIAAD
jgi:hypothetical protein